MRELEQLLKRNDIGASISRGFTRLYYDQGEWVVITREARRKRTLYRGESLRAAIGWFNACFDELRDS